MVYLLYVYTKDDAEKLTPAQKKELRTVVEAIKREWETRTQEG